MHVIATTWEPNKKHALKSVDQLPTLSLGYRVSIVYSICQSVENSKISVDDDPKIVQTLGGSRDLISFNTALSSCVRSQWQTAFRVFEKLRADGNEPPDAFTFSSLVRACESSQRWQTAVGLCMMTQPNVVTYSAAMSACQSAAQWQEAWFLFGSMRSTAMLPNVITYSAVLSACDKGGQWERSLKLFQEMGESQVLPDSVACGAALSACERGLWQLALHLLFSMPSAALKLDSICFSSAITSCSRAGRWKEVLNLVQDMLKLGVSDFSIARYEHVSQAGSTLDCFKHVAGRCVLECVCFVSFG